MNRQNHQGRKKGKRPTRGRRKGKKGKRGKRTEREVLPTGPPVPVEGVFQGDEGGAGYLRTKTARYLPRRNDVRVPAAVAREAVLRSGVRVEGNGVKGREGTVLTEVAKIDGATIDAYRDTLPFEDFVSIDPEEKFDLSRTGDLSLRVIDLLTPLGKGQRALIVAPPRSGKTVLLQKIGKLVNDLGDGTKLFVLLVNERPEEVTEFRRAVGGEVISSSLDEDTQNHARVADLVLERGKRLAERGRDVVIVLDSLTRLARAHNLVGRSSGRTMSGGLDAKSLERPKRIFGAARNLEGAGSLTIVATALIDTGSRGDQVIYEEFKGTGNMELHLSRDLANRRIWPAVDIELSGTRKEEKLLDVDDLRRIRAIRRVLSRAEKLEAMEILIAKLSETESNNEFLDMIDREMKAKTR
ncbi:MAG: transcription termination factor Rho [Planctomycetota bacterium]|jgi:transcription termination factor Rho